MGEILPNPIICKTNYEWRKCLLTACILNKACYANMAPHDDDILSQIGDMLISNTDKPSPTK